LYQKSILPAMAGGMATMTARQANTRPSVVCTRTMWPSDEDDDGDGGGDDDDDDDDDEKEEGGWTRSLSESCQFSTRNTGEFSSNAPF